MQQINEAWKGLFSCSFQGLDDMMAKGNDEQEVIKLRFYNQDLLQNLVMSTPNPVSSAQSTKLNKLELFGDLLAFGSVVAAYLFVSQTLHNNYLEQLLGLSLASANDIIIVYLLYSLFIIILKCVAWIAKVIRKEETVFSKELEANVGHSLFKVTSFVTLSILSASFGVQRCLETLSLIAFWVFVAELNIIFCRMLKGVTVIEGLSLFGSTIEALILIAQIGSLLSSFDLLTFL